MFVEAFFNIFTIVAGDSTSLVSIVIKSLLISFTSTLFASLFGVVAAVLLYLFEFRGKSFLLLILNTTLSVPTVVIGLFFYGLLSRSGFLGGLNLLYTQTAIVIGQFFLILPIIIAFSFSALHSLSPFVLKSAKALGANSLFCAKIVIQEAKFGIIAACIAAFGRAISEVGISMMLGGNIQGFTRTMTSSIALEHNKGNFAFGLALGIVLLVVTLSINLVFTHLQKRGKSDI